MESNANVTRLGPREPSRLILIADAPVVFPDEPGAFIFFCFFFFFWAKPPGSRAPLLDWNVPFENPPTPAMPLAHSPTPAPQPPLCMAKPWMHDSVEPLQNCWQILFTFTFLHLFLLLGGCSRCDGADRL